VLAVATLVGGLCEEACVFPHPAYIS